MKKLLAGLLIINFFYACSPKSGDALTENESPAHLTPIVSSLNLAEVTNDRIWVEVDPGMFTEDTVTYRLPRVVQGTYDVSDFGSFTEGFIAYDYTGNTIEVVRADTNTWLIPRAGTLDKIGYYVNDTFDIERTDKPTPFSPSGTNIEAENFVLNLHGFIGYFEELNDSEYSIKVTAPADFKKSSALPVTSTTTSEDGSTITDTYFAERYFEVTDNPMMYGELEIEEFQVGDIKIVLSVYSPTMAHSAAEIKETVFTMMEAQKEYLGDLNSTKRYDIFLYMPTNNEGEATGFGALEHHTSTVVVLPEWLDKQRLDEAMIDVVSHEFFHIVTPLSVHSEDVHYFDYNDPTFSKHLWMYEGVTEYFASHFQVYEDLQDRSTFYEKITDKIETAAGLDDEMSFTVMSEYILEEPYASNYYNVYMKGALIGMCIDILMREESNGERSMLSLMKELSEKYGIDQPFEDDSIIEEITAMTYPSVGEFLNTHVVGDTPIDYSMFFDKVGLKIEEEAVPTSFFFIDQQTPYIDAHSTGELYFRNVTLNSSHIELGIQPGDEIKSVNGIEYTLENAQPLIGGSFSWTPDTELIMVLVRDGEEIEVSGVAGNPTVISKNLIEKEEATEEQIQLRNYWLEK
ncbi:MAG: peptidase M61 [Balneolaceae bacterium]|nr:peptidase M61 [Balneolaceae bacterium]MBO6547036.1 peptidase M61 [Balneolaceae bacterium]MBO6648017.1 peptidase M61 [Balneolaceae bacterium]